jgi:hypothetical protein
MSWVKDSQTVPCRIRYPLGYGDIVGPMDLTDKLIQVI